MTKRLTDEEIFHDWWINLWERQPLPQEWKDMWIRLIGKAREEEPRINRGSHLEDYWSICDDDDDMDSFYGKDYFDQP